MTYCGLQKQFKKQTNLVQSKWESQSRIEIFYIFRIEILLFRETSEEQLVREDLGEENI